MRNFSDKILDKLKTQFMLSNFFFPRKSCHLWGNVEKYFRATQATDDSVVHAHCMMDTLVYKHLLRIC